jgi:outer membrane protein W
MRAQQARRLRLMRWGDGRMNREEHEYMNSRHQVAAVTIAVWTVAVSAAAAQDGGRVYAGALFGVSTLSADARAVTADTSASASMYKPENGIALNAFVGTHLGRFFTLQGNYIFNRNGLTLFASTTSQTGGGFYEQPRDSSQHAIVADALVYFRRRGSGVRPYLGAGLAVVRFTSAAPTQAVARGLTPPSAAIESTRVALRSHVGIDFAVGRGWTVRYSFSETIGGNPISPRLMPPGERGMANFQNLFGLLAHF